MEKSKTIKNAGVMLLASMLAKIIGALYRIPLTNILGTEGIGIYQLVFTVFAFVLALTSGAVPGAMSILLGGINDDKLKKKYLSFAFGFVGILSAVVSIFIIALAYPIAKLQGNNSAMYGYFCIAPSILLVGILSVLRGWFNSKLNFGMTAISEIIEVVVKLGIGFALAWVLKKYGIVAGVCGALIGVTASEIVALLALFIVYKRENIILDKSVFRGEREIGVGFVYMLIPLIIGNMMMPLSQFADGLLVINLINKSVNNVAIATKCYGLYSGPITSLINLPIAIGLTVGIVIQPEISKHKAEHSIFDIKAKLGMSIKLALITVIPFCILFVLIPSDILSVLYPKLTADELLLSSKLLVLGAVLVLVLSVVQICNSILATLGKTMASVMNMSIGVMLKIFLDILLIPKVGIEGVMIASVAGFCVTGILNCISLIKLVGKSTKLIKNIGVCVLAGVIMGAVIYLSKLISPQIWVLFVGIAIGGTVYLVFVFLLGVFSKDELGSIPLVKRFIK